MTSLYRLFDNDDHLLYVGVSRNFFERAKRHSAEKAWWRDVARTTVEHFPSRMSALAAEKEAIRCEGPLYNVIHTRATPGDGAIFTRLDASKRKALKHLAAEKDTTVAELVRQAIDRFLAEETAQ